MKVFIGFADTAGFASRLGSLLENAGHEVVWINTAPNYLNPEVVNRAGFVEVAPRLFRTSKRIKDERPVLYFFVSPFLFLRKLAAYLSALRRSEVMIFLGCGMLLPGYLDRRLARWCRRRTINVFLGSASRPVILGGAGLHMAEQGAKKLRKLAKKLRRQRRRVRRIAGICHEIVENPLCSQFQPRACIDWFRLGFPSGGDLFTVDPDAVPRQKSEQVTILHCPSKPRIKGTDRIREVIEKLKKQGLPINYVEITGMPHAEVLKQLAQCDFVIDELYSDSPLAGFASEAAWFSKPAVVGGYGWEILRNLPSGEDLAPSAACRPDELEETVRGLVCIATVREEQGRRAKEYSEGFLGGAAYVARVDKVLRGEVPEDWRFDPKSVCYVHGLGQNEDDLRAGLRKYIEMFGERALCFAERPDLEKAIAEFVAGGTTAGD